ncbi:MAG: hypothetical protein U0R26_01730 [Solirubrobacterales bacterium]
MEVDDAIRKLEIMGRWSRWLLVDSAVVALAAAVLVIVSTGLAIALGLGAACLLAAALAVGGQRRELIGRLAVRGDAYVIPEVARYGRRAAAPAQLARLSDWLREAVDSCGDHYTWYVEERVLAYAEEIVTLASELRAPDVSVTPVSAVECKRLLTRMVESPLYNYRLPPENLRASLYRIRAGIRPAAGAAA